MGKPLSRVGKASACAPTSFSAVLSPNAGFKKWSATYDHTPNPLLALEQRFAVPLLGSLNHLRVADVCAGTGRWTSIARDQGARVVAIDLCAEMLRIAAGKAGQVVLADVLSLPLAADSFDLAICSFGISYVSCITLAFAEMSRVARRILVSDLHPAAAEAGWTRTLPIETFRWSFADLDIAARKAGLQEESTIEAHFGDSERSIFATAGKSDVFDELSRIPAIFVKTWTRPC